MLQIAVPLTPEYWDEKKQEFIPAETATLQLEHSLVSISKWESKWCKSFIASSKKLTDEEISLPADSYAQKAWSSIKTCIRMYTTT